MRKRPALTLLSFLMAAATVILTACDVPPLADAGPDQIVNLGDVVTLDGSSSYDRDPLDPNNSITYNWIQIGGTLVTLNDANTAHPTFAALNVGETLIFQLTVTDDEGNSATDTVNITISTTPVSTTTVPISDTTTTTTASSTTTTASVDAEQTSIFLESPTYETNFTSDTNPVPLSGMGDGPIGTMTWKNVTTGQSGSVNGKEAWSALVSLQEGDNQIEVTARSSESGEEVIMPLTVTYNTSVKFTSLAQLIPDAGFVGQTYNDVYMRVAIDESTLNPTSVKVHSVDDLGNKVNALGTLTDDGNVNNGDEIEGDGIYSAKISLTSPAIDLINMRIFASNDQGKEAKTAVSSFVFIDELSDQDLTQQIADNEMVSNKFEELISNKVSEGLSEEESAVESLDALKTYVEGMDGVLAADKGGYTVWWLNDNLFTFVIDASDYYFKDAFLSGGEERENIHRIEMDESEADIEKPDTGYTRIEYFKTAVTTNEEMAQILAVEEQYRVGSLSAIHISPFKDVSERWAASTAWENVLKDNQCLDTKTSYINTASDPVMYNPGGNLPAIFNAWKELSNYGLIATITHGNNIPGLKQKVLAMAEKWANEKGRQLYPDKSFDWLKKYAVRRIALIHTWNKDAREYFRTDVGLDGSKSAWESYRTAEQFQSIRSAVRQNRIILLLKKNKSTNEYYYEILITPEFITKHNGNFPKSIWFATACRSASTFSMARVFRAKGGLAYLGFSNLVKQQYGVDTQRTFFDALVNDGKTVGEALQIVKSIHQPNDGGTWPGGPAEIRGKGKEEAAVVFELKNPSFEDPDGAGSLDGWTQSGDARDVKQLGSTTPTHGNTMAIISTGFVSSSYGNLSQTLCLDDDVENLIFDWNFFSEEFKEFCNRGFNDTFQVTITDKETEQETVLFETSVDTLCDGCDGDDLESEACQNLPLIPASVSFDQGEVWCTGWNQNQTVDLSSYRSKAVILKFYIVDKGDTVYDTAVLVDNLRITPSP